MDSAFRDDRQALRQRLDALEAEITEHCRGLTPHFWLTLDEETLGQIEALRAARREVPQAGASHDALMAAVAAAERHKALITEALRTLTQHEQSWLALPTTVSQGVAGPLHEVSTDAVDYVMHQTALTTRGERLDAIFATLESATVHSRTIDPAWRWELSAHGIPLRATLGIHHAPHLGLARELQVTLTTSVSRRTARIELTPERWSDVLLRTLGLRHDVTLGDPDFDSFFVVEGELPALRVLLTGAVRRSLLRIAREDVPCLSTRGDAASISWRYTPSPAAVLAAVRVLASIRLAPPTVHFRTG